MATEVGQAYVTLIPSAKGFASKMQKEIGGDIAKAGKAGGDAYSDEFAKEAGDGVTKKGSSIFKKLAGAAAGLFVASQVKDFFADSIGEAREAAVVTARTQSVIKSMGNASKISAGQVADLAGSLSTKVGMDDEAIQAGENLLLTFGNIRNEAGKGNDIFTQTTGLMVDMSKAMGTDVKGAAIQLGKALNDPTKGVTALTRVGVAFTDQQKAQIKKLQESGKTLAAQKIVMAEVKKEFGGAGAAMATPAEKAQVAFGNFKESIGTALLPIVDKLLTRVSTLLPQILEFAKVVADKLGPGLKTALRAATSLLGFMADHLTTVKVMAALFGALVLVTEAHAAAMWLSTGGLKAWIVQTKIVQAATKAWAAIQWVLDAALSANPIGIIILAVIALIAAVVLIVRHLGGWNAAMEDLGHVADVVWKAIKGAFDKVKAVITGAVGWVVDFIKQHWKTALLTLLLGPFGLVIGLIAEKWDKIKAAVSSGVNAVLGVIKGLPGRILALGGMFLNAGSALIGMFIQGLRNAAGLVGGIAGSIWDAVKSLLNSAIDQLNQLLEFEIGLPFGKSVTINPPDIPHLANGARASRGTLAVIGEGREAETVLPDSLLRGLMENAHAAGAGGQVGALTITNWREGTGYFRLLSRQEADSDSRFHREIGAMYA